MANPVSAGTITPSPESVAGGGIPEPTPQAQIQPRCRMAPQRHVARNAALPAAADRLCNHADNHPQACTQAEDDPNDGERKDKDCRQHAAVGEWNGESDQCADDA